MISEIDPISENGNVDEEKTKKNKKIIQLGVNDLAAIHSPEGGWAMDSSSNFYFSKSLSLPKNTSKALLEQGMLFAEEYYTQYKIILILKKLCT